MKRKLLLALTLVAIFTFVFALSVSAEILEWTETQDLGFSPKTTTDGTVTFDTTSRVLLSNGDGTYTTYPTYYIIKGTDTKFSVSTELDFTALNNAITDTGITYSYSSVVKMEIPSGYVSTEARALRSDKGFSAMQFVKLPEGFTTLGEFTFYANKVLVEVILPESLETIEGDQTFREATALAKVNIPSKIKSLPLQIFYKCSSLVEVTGCENLVDLADSAFNRCPLTNTDTSIFEKLETVSTYAFYSCNGITSLSLPNVKTIGKEAIAYCNALESLSIGSGANVTGTNAFANNSALTTLSLGENITFAYPSNAFSNTKNITTVYYTGEDASALESITNIAASSVQANTNYCVAFYEGIHALSDTVTPVFTGDSFISTCNVGSVCTRDGCGEGAIKSTLEPLFSFAGFSKSDYNGAIMQSLAIDKALLPQYTELFGKISFGLLAAVEDVDPSDEVAGQFGGVLYDSESNTFKNKVASVDFSEKSYDVFEMKITGLDAYANATVYCCGYVMANGKLLYLHNGTASSTPTAITYSSIS